MCQITRETGEDRVVTVKYDSDITYKIAFIKFNYRQFRRGCLAQIKKSK